MRNLIGTNPFFPKVSVLLSIHKPNLEWLNAQLQSLKNQQHVLVDVLCRLDDSGTMASIHSENLRVLQNNDHLGPGESFMELVGSCDYGSVAFCDQDDLWAPHKLDILVEALKTHTGPALSYSGFTIIGATGQSLGARNPTKKTTKFTFLFRNSIPGCTMLLNESTVILLKASRPFFPKGGIHDWWVALLVSLTGVLVPVPEALISYRLHDLNSIGMSTTLEMRKQNFRRRLRVFEVTIKQLEGAMAFLEFFGGYESTVSFLNSIILGCHSSRMFRLKTLIRHGILKSNLSEIIFSILLYLIPRKLAK
jgi:hypothetical protein